MKLVIVRHADPDYEHDSLTQTGFKEAKALVPRMVELNNKCGGFKNIYCSPLGRAKDTAKFTLDELGRTAIIKDWLREFPPAIKRPDLNGQQSICWDFLPEDWTKYKEFYDADLWCKHPIMKSVDDVEAKYKQVCTNFDELLKEHGYERCDEKDGIYYNAINSNNDTIVIFCHFGLESVLISHLTHTSPMILWHNFCTAPSSVTTIATEERREGKASFRVIQYGDTSHLYKAGLEPSFAARFCESYTNENERHD